MYFCVMIVRERQRRRRRRHDRGVGEERRLLGRRDLRRRLAVARRSARSRSRCATRCRSGTPSSAVALSPIRYAASALMNCSCAYVMTGIFDLVVEDVAARQPEPAAAGVAEEVVRLLRRGQRAEARRRSMSRPRILRRPASERRACGSCADPTGAELRAVHQADDELRLAVRRDVVA